MRKLVKSVTKSELVEMHFVTVCIRKIACLQEMEYVFRGAYSIGRLRRPSSSSVRQQF